MDILWALLTFPYAPVRGVTAVVKVIAREAESRQHDPANVRRELEALDRAAAAGDITERERDRAQQRILDRLTGTGGRRAGQTGGRRAEQTGGRVAGQTSGLRAAQSPGGARRRSGGGAGRQGRRAG
ncbi:gas vesicle protein GvpG [Micromonospora okii]|uniref:gas vesicle protein GvpG n=1 Tax=Micromonospora okii TaxID=1182970 RepID=UPI001E65432F|nr:gas vesicle protein GvpG [Micromonospora okii]